MWSDSELYTVDGDFEDDFLYAKTKLTESGKDPTALVVQDDD